MMPTSGSATAASAAICPRPRMPISTITASVSGSIGSRVRGTPTSLFWLAAVATTRRTRPTMAPRMSLVLVLPALPVTANTVTPELAAHLPGQRAQGRQGVVAPGRRAAPRRVAPAPRPCCSRPPRRTRRRPARPPRSHARRTARPAGPRTGRRAGATRLSMLTPGTGAASGPTPERPPGFFGVERDHRPGLPQSRQRLAGHLPVVEGDGLRGELLPRLVALAQDHHHVARAGLGHRRRRWPAAGRAAPSRAAGASRPAGDLGDDGQRVLAARVVRGHDHQSAAFSASRPISGRLPLSRSPPQPTTAISLPWVKPRAVCSTLRTESGVWA